MKELRQIRDEARNAVLIVLVPGCFAVATTHERSGDTQGTL